MEMALGRQRRQTPQPSCGSCCVVLRCVALPGRTRAGESENENGELLLSASSSSLWVAWKEAGWLSFLLSCDRVSWVVSRALRTQVAVALLEAFDGPAWQLAANNRTVDSEVTVSAVAGGPSASSASLGHLNSAAQQCVFCCSGAWCLLLQRRGTKHLRGNDDDSCEEEGTRTLFCTDTAPIRGWTRGREEEGTGQGT